MQDARERVGLVISLKSNYIPDDRRNLSSQQAIASP
jgi:hypothetical protein